MPIFEAALDSLVEPPERNASLFSRRKTKIDPKVQKYDNESRAKQFPTYGQQRPEEAAVAELPHPQCLLYHAGYDRQESDGYDRRNKNEFQGAPSSGDAVRFGNFTFCDYKRPRLLDVCWFLDHCSGTTFPRDEMPIFSLGPKSPPTPMSPPFRLGDLEDTF